MNLFQIEWIEPLPNETIEQYAKRLAQCIDTSQPYVIIGVSFGGLIATEINLN